MVHWADVTAADLLQARPGDQLFATAITPSGPIHVGNMREVLTSEAVFRAAKDAGATARFIYIADDYDPLRKVYPFLHESYAGHVGKPLREIPCPDAQGRPNGCGRHDHYAAHFLEPFLSLLVDLGIEPEVLSAYDMYHEGRYAAQVEQAVRRADKLRTIIEKVAKRQLAKSWAPFNPQCPTCRKLSGVEVTELAWPVLKARCTCGDFEVDLRKPGGGKLPWRIDWPARWVFLGVTFESAGKDHHAAGGSWDTGQAICREVFDGEPPYGIMYEFIQLKGQGAMHSSTGLAVSAEEVLRMTPPEVLRYLLMRQSPRKHIDFDPGLGLLSLVDEFDRFERVYFGAEENPGTFTEVERTYELSCPRGVPAALPVKAPYKHLVTIAQMADTVEEIAAVLERSGEVASGADLDDLRERVSHVRYWLKRFAPDQVKFRVQKELPVLALGDADKTYLSQLSKVLAGTAWTGQAIHDAIYEAKGERSAGDAFRPVYQAILGQERGPRAGFFLSSLNKDWVVERLAAAAA